MAIDKLQDRIRKLKSPLAVDLFAQPEHIPARFLDENPVFIRAYKIYCEQLLDAMRETVAAIRMDYGMFSLYGAEGLDVLREISIKAHKLGFYVLMQIPEPLSRRSAENEANILFNADIQIWFDGVEIAAFIGSDAITPFLERLRESDKDIFVVARTSNRSASEMQDLRSGSRLAYMAKADVVNRYADSLIGKSGYSRIALVAAASSTDCLRALREKYSHLFFLLDGGDYPNSNAKNCSAAFDKLGHGALMCVGLSVTAAWTEIVDVSSDDITAALKALERHRRNVLRYITIL